MVTEQVPDYLRYAPVAATKRGSRGLSKTISFECRRLGYLRRWFARDEQHGAFRPFEQFRRNLTKEELVAGSRTYTHHQKIMAIPVEMIEDGVLWCAAAAHRTFYLNTIMFPSRTTSRMMASHSTPTRARRRGGVAMNAACSGCR